MRSVHRALGLIMVIPLLAWLLSGVFLLMWGPGGGEPTPLEIPSRPIERAVTVRPGDQWVETKILGTVLGSHLLQRTEFGWRHLDPNTGQLKPVPSERQLRTLIESALAVDPGRYGTIESVTADSIVTTTGHVVFFDWTSLTAVQRQPDAARVSFVRRVHGFAVTGDPAIDNRLAAGVALAGCLLALVGMVLFFVGGGDARASSGTRR